MDERPPLQGRPSGRGEIARGARDSVSLGFALVPVGLAFGYVAHAIRLSWWLAGLMSTLVYAGPSQFLAAGLVAVGAGTPAIVATTFVANLRYSLFGSSLVPYLRDAPTWELLPLAHAVADGSYAVVVRDIAEHPERRRRDLYLLGSALVSCGFWVPSVVVGALVGSALPTTLAYGLDFATPAIFIGFLVPLVRDRVALAVALAAGAGTVLGNRYLPAGAGPVLAIVVASLVGGSIRWERERRSS